MRRCEPTRPVENHKRGSRGRGCEPQSFQRRPYGRRRKCDEPSTGSTAPVGALPRGDVSGQRLGDETADTLAPLAAAGDFAYIEPDEPADPGRIVTVRAHDPGGATRGAASDRRDRPERPAVGEPRPARHRGDPGQRDDDARRGGIRRAGGLRRKPPSLPLWRPEAAEAVFRSMSPGAGIR